MTLPVSGEQHDKAILAMAMADSPDPGGHAPLDVYERQVRTYFASLAKQGARMVDVNEIVAMLRDPPRFSIYSPSRAEWFRAANFIERRFASEDTAKEER